MFLRVIDGLVRFVIVDRVVVLMMVVIDALTVLHLVDERDRVCDRRQAALHGETIQGQAQQQEDVDNPTQGNHQANFAKLYQSVRSHWFPSKMFRTLKDLFGNYRNKNCNCSYLMILWRDD
jgi:hypothetical protein